MSPTRSRLSLETSFSTSLDCVRINNDPVWFAEEASKAPKGSHVVIEATYGWYWAVDLLKDLGYEVHLSNPHGNDWGKRRVKNDGRDARDLATISWAVPGQMPRLLLQGSAG